MSQNYHRLGEFAINFDAIRYIQRIKGDNGFYFHIYFVGSDQPVMINENESEGKALLNWWQNTVRELPDGTEKASSFRA